MNFRPVRPSPRRFPSRAKVGRSTDAPPALRSATPKRTARPATGRFKRQILCAVLILAGSVPAEAVLRAAVQAYVAAKAAHSRAQDGSTFETATVVPTTTAGTYGTFRAPAPSSGPRNEWAGSPVNRPAQSGLYTGFGGVPATSVAASGQRAAPAVRPAFSRAPGTPPITVGLRATPPVPATTYNGSFIVDSTDNPGGQNTLTAGNTITVNNGNTIIGNNHVGVFTQSGGTFNNSPVNGVVIGQNAGSNGTFNLQGGTFSASQTYVGFLGPGTVNQSGGTFVISGSSVLLAVGSNTASGTYVLSGAASLTTPQTIVSNGDNTSTFTQSGTSTHTTGSLVIGYHSFQAIPSVGTYNLDGGTLTTGRVGTSANSDATSTFNFNGGTLRASASDNPGTSTFFSGLTTANVRGGGATIDTNGFNVTVSQALVHSGISGDGTIDGGLTKNGTGTLTLTGVSTYTGDTVVNTGTLAVPSGGLNATRSVSANSNGTLALSGTGNITTTSLSVTNGTFNQSGGTVGIMTSGGVTMSGGTINQTGGTLNASGTPLLIGYFGSSTSTYNLSGANSQLSTAGVFLGYNTNGTFVQNGGSFTTNGSVFEVGAFAGGTGTLMLNGGSLSTGGFAVGDQGSGLVYQSGGMFTTNGNGLSVGTASGTDNAYTLSGGTLTTGSTTITGGSSSTYFYHTGGTHITGGVTIGSGNADSAGVYYLDGGTLSTGSITGGAGTSRLLFNGGIVQPRGDSTNFISGITGANVRNGGAIFDTNGFNATVPQVIDHTNFEGDNAIDGGLTKNSTGILSLTGANTYTGATTVNGGTLAANNIAGSATGPGAVTVQASATLAGNGTIAGSVTLNSTATLNPGNGGAGRLTIGGTLALNSGSAFALELGGTTAGSGYDQLVLAGPVTTGGLFTLGGNLSVTKLSGFTLAVGQKFFIIDETGTNPVGGMGTFANTTANVYTDAAGNRFLVNYADVNPADGNTIPNDVSLTVLTVATIPEPSTWTLLLLGIGSAVLWVGQRRKRRA